MLNEKDLQLINSRLSKQAHKDIALRMFVMALLGSTTITAPEIQKCTMLLENYLQFDVELEKKVENISPAE